MPDSKPTLGQKDVCLLSDEELRVKIGEFVEKITNVPFWLSKEDHLKNYVCCPDYCHDLNAMHEAEEVMTREQKDEYWLRLCREVVPLNQRAWRSTARQRAEAFVLTMTK